MYLVKYSTGSWWDSWAEHELFVTSDKAKADRYAAKMNRIGPKLCKYYNELYYDCNDEDRIAAISDKYDKWGEFNKCYVMPIEVR